MTSLKTTTGLLLRVTSVTLFTGDVELTVGMVVSEAIPVVKVQTLLFARALSARSIAPVLIVAVYKVLAAKVLDGLKVAVVPT